MQQKNNLKQWFAKTFVLFPSYGFIMVLRGSRNLEKRKPRIWTARVYMKRKIKIIFGLFVNRKKFMGIRNKKLEIV